MRISMGSTIPVLRIFDERLAKDFYVDFLGFEVTFEFRFDAESPLYMGVQRGACRLHLTEMHGDACPGASVCVQMSGIREYQEQLLAKKYKFARPGPPRETEWGTRELSLGDPFGNRLHFAENLKEDEDPARSPLATKMRATLEDAMQQLYSLNGETAGTPPAPGKWSPKEVMGHLIDSATINYQRFAQAAVRPDLVADTYDQNHFVSLARPGEVNWIELLDLWIQLNRRILRLMEGTPKDDLTRPRAEHNLHQIAWAPFTADQPVSLEDFMDDYIGHMQHHLATLVPGSA